MSKAEDDADNKAQEEFLLARFLKGIHLVAPEHQRKMPEYVEFCKKWFGKNAGGPNKHEGYLLYPGFEPATAKYAYDKLQVKSGDVLVATYPKTGTVWVGTIVRHILGRKDPQLLQKYMDSLFFFSFLSIGPVSKYEVVENLPLERMVYGSHMPAPLINIKKFTEKGAKVIYVIRNPKDQAVSWYNFMMTHPQAKSEYWKPLLPKNEKEFYDLYIAGKQFVFAKKGEGYLETVREWYEHKEDKNVLFLMFEEIKKDPRGEIRRVAEFIGESPTENELDWILEKTSINSMKEVEQSSLDQSEAIKIVRKGEIGNWKNHLTAEQSDIIDRKVQQILGDTDIKFIYE